MSIKLKKQSKLGRLDKIPPENLLTYGSLEHSIETLLLTCRFLHLQVVHIFGKSCLEVVYILS